MYVHTHTYVSWDVSKQTSQCSTIGVLYTFLTTYIWSTAYLRTCAQLFWVSAHSTCMYIQSILQKQQTQLTILSEATASSSCLLVRICSITWLIILYDSVTVPCCTQEVRLEAICSFNNKNKNTQIAAAARRPLTTHPLPWAEPHTQ